MRPEQSLHYTAFLQRLSQSLERSTVEFDNFVKEEDTIVRQAHLAGTWFRATADEGDR